MNYNKKFLFMILSSLGFVLIIALLGYRFENIHLLEDQGASWYYWKLPQADFMARLSAWSFYLLHQACVWILIYKMQSHKENREKYRNILMILTGLFVALHIVQSHIWYDGLAQDVPVMSSQGSVIVMLVLILIMENKRRGIFFGKSIKSLPFISDLNSPVAFIRKYHGYFISWAVVYTFWYHPTVATQGHLVGFFYIFLLFIQIIMVYTPMHTNKYWNFLLEVLVLFHGTTVAIGQNNNMWPMFMFGFASMLVVTQIYGIDLNKWTRRLVQIIYIVGVILVFGGFTGHKSISEVHQISWIPIIEYLLVFVFIYFSNAINSIVQKINN